MGTSESFKLELLLKTVIEDDGYAAALVIKETDAATPFVTNDIADYLRRHSIVYGFDVVKLDEVIKKLKNGTVGATIPVARGKRLTPGKDGIEDFRFRTTLLAGAQTETRTDYRERGLINNVRAGQVIAIIHKEIPGKPGLMVNGNKIEPPPVRCVTICEAGMNVERYVEGIVHTYIAMKAGHVRRIFDEIQVMKDFMIEGDVDYTKGNIDFVGNVGISGDVKSGFSIIAAGDIAIGGNVEPGAIVKSEKSISVRGTVRCGMENGLFEAREDITARSVISSKIQSGRNVFIKEFISDSEVYCEGAFASSWGTILGSTIEAIGGINVNKIGKEDGLSKNVIYSGKSTLSEEKRAKNDAELLNLKNEIALIAKKIAIERDSGTVNEEAMDPTERDRLKQIGSARSKLVKQLNERIEEINKEQALLAQRHCVNREAVMVVNGKLFPTVILRNGINECKVIDTVVDKLRLEYREVEPSD